MNKLTVNFSLVGAGIFSLFPLSAQSQVVINSTQNAAINGDNNQITQVINQTIIYQPQKPRFARPGNMNRPDFKKDDDDKRRRNNGRHGDHSRKRFHGDHDD
jgi:hypothetical protein